MASEKKNVLLQGKDNDDTSINEIFTRHDEALSALGVAAPAPLQSLPAELQRAVRVLCDTYETLDLRVETTLGNAAEDLLSALPEIEDHKDALRYLVTVLTSSITSASGTTQSQAIFLHFAYRDEQELTKKLAAKLNRMEKTS